MGNRATVIFTCSRDREISPAVYLHWNGGPESIYAFLAELVERNGFCHSAGYSAARFASVVADFLDHSCPNGHSLGIANGPRRIDARTLAGFNPGDNGVYVVELNGGSYRMRRFAGYEKRFAELDRDKVAAEKAEALRHPYNTAADGIPSLFEHLRPLRSPKAA